MIYRGIVVETRKGYIASNASHQLRRQAQARHIPLDLRTTETMTTNEYPQLSEMGIEHPLQIERYQVNSISNYDVLRVIYERGKDSFLPSSRTYKFPRVQTKAAIGKDEKSVQSVLETHPGLKKALDELESLLAKKECKECVADTVLVELQALEDEIAMRNEYIRELVRQLGTK